MEHTEDDYHQKVAQMRFDPRLDAVLKMFPQDTSPKTSTLIDGYVIGILTCPDFIPPSEWFLDIRNRIAAGDFWNQKAFESIIRATVKLYNFRAGEMNKLLMIKPSFLVDVSTMSAIWAPWLGGFFDAVELKSETWRDFFENADKEAKSSFNNLMNLRKSCDDNVVRYDRNGKKIDDDEFPSFIAKWLNDIIPASRTRHSSDVAPNIPLMANPQFDRNESCFCGSELKYKKCCWRN